MQKRITDMVKTVYGILLFLGMAFCLPAQECVVSVKYMPANADDSVEIFYNASRKLKWSDFLGDRRIGGTVAAETSSGIGYKYKSVVSEDGARIDFNVYCFFDRNRSWVLASGGKTDYNLNHEQRHFDISFIHTLLFIRQLRCLHVGADKVKSQVGACYREISVALNAMQADYDAQTHNGIDKEKQQEWDKKIDKMKSDLLKSVSL